MPESRIAALRQLGQRVLDALERRDMAALTDCLDPDVRLHVLLPSGVRERSGQAAAVDTFAGWFADPADTIDVVQSSLEVLGDRLALSWRIRVASPGGADLVEQHLYATAGNRGLATLRLLCSGFLPETEMEGVLP